MLIKLLGISCPDVSPNLENQTAEVTVLDTAFNAGPIG